MKIFIVAIFLFVGSFCYAQNFKTSIVLSTGLSWYNSSNIEMKTGGNNFCFPLAIREELYFSDVFSLGSELNYLYTKGSFSSPSPPSYVGQIPEENEFYQHYLYINSLNLPLFFKIRTKSELNKGIYFSFGTGVSYIIKAYRNVDHEFSGKGGTNLSNITTITKGSVVIKTESNNLIGTIGIFGIGKNIKIKNKIFFCELKYMFDLNKWYYPTINDPLNITFDIKRQCLLLNFGFTF